ncbi:MAG: hypothetical protein N838_19915 [Thiohalocapsa sp. PB-PSB1]|nr:MAG: hypothetical protein N838_19915 [Thiohalocapsa sp. PB-PSB1]
MKLESNLKDYPVPNIFRMAPMSASQASHKSIHYRPARGQASRA